MEYIDSEKRQITFDDPEFKKLFSEVMEQADVINRRNAMSEESFRDWLCEFIELFAAKLGYVIQNVKEITLDMAYSFNKGFNAGREQAIKNSYRYRDQHNN